MPRGSAFPVEQREFPARFTSLTDSAEFVDTFCARHGLDTDLALKLTLVLEELFTNTITHGFGAESDATVRIALTASHAQSVSLIFEDTGPAFDPLAADTPRPHTLDGAFGARPVGGLGIHLVKQFASAQRYAREDGRNRLWLTLDSAADSSQA